MARARLWYFRFLGATVLLFLLGAWLSGVHGDPDSLQDLARFLIFAAGIGSAVGTWGTAVVIASVHKVAWPLVTTALAVAMSCGVGAIWWHGLLTGP